MAIDFPETGGTQDVFYTRPQAVPLPMMTRAEGIRFWDEDGKEYIDASSGPRVSALGHGNRNVVAAMSRQALQLDYAYTHVARSRINNIYADERGKYLAFKATHDHLVTRLAAAEVIRDMVSVAQHRQWESLQVRGSVDFRREAWLEAGARGIEVQGYRPTDLDRQALSDRQEAGNRTHPRTHELEVRPAPDRDALTERPDYDKGVAGRLIEIGQAPYRNRNNAEPIHLCGHQA